MPAATALAGQVTFLEGDAAQITPLLAPADVIVSNILRLINARAVARGPSMQSARAESPFSPAWSSGGG